MRNIIVLFLCVLLVLTSLFGAAWGKGTQDRLSGYRFIDPPPAPTNQTDFGGPMHRSAAASTTFLGWWQFDDPFTGQCDQQGWIIKDRTSQAATYFHVDGNDPGDPGCTGVTPVNGQGSMWCGQWATTVDPWCGWAALPGYGNSWDQYLESDTLACDTLSWAWTAVWESEPGYDYTYAEYYDPSQSAFVALPVNGGTGLYDGAGGPLMESHQVGLVPGPTGWTILRYRFVSDGGWSDEDGLWPTNQGAFMVDDITVACQGGPTHFHDFEAEVCKQTQSNDLFWEARTTPPFGSYARLVSGASVLQEDPCHRVISCLWAFFDDPSVTNYACGGHPLQGAMPYGPDENGLYMRNEIWSPWVPNIGTGSEYRLQFLVYRDLPLNALQFYMWFVRSKDASGCPGDWGDYSWVYYGGGRDWLRTTFSVGPLLDPGAIEIQLSLGAIDMCGYWCGIYGTGACHTHAPLFDQVRLLRIDFEGPQWNARHIDLFQDNFPEDGDITCTSYARADMATDILPNSNGNILPGDSVVVQVSDPSHVYTPLNPPDDDPDTSIPPQVYCWVRVGSHLCQTKTHGSGAHETESPDWERFPGAGPHPWTIRYPYMGQAQSCGPWTYHKYQCDFVFSSGAGLVWDRYCFDLRDIYNGRHTLEDPTGNDGCFTPGDTIYYFFEAVPNVGPSTYLHRNKVYRLGQGASNTTNSWDEACKQPMEFMILPDSGREVEADILFVDDADDRGGPAEVYFDLSFEDLNIMNLMGERYHGPFYAAFTANVDIYDVLGPSSCVGNSLASRVKGIFTQIIGDPKVVYQKILWNSSNLSSGLIGDGGPPNAGSGPEKSLDYCLLETFLKFHPNHPGVYAAGDNMAQEWVTLTHPCAIGVRATYMMFTLLSPDHVTWGLNPTELVRGDLPESIYTIFDAVAAPPAPPYSDYWNVYGGCPLINDFDVLAPTASPCSEQAEYITDGSGAVLAQATPNDVGTTARYILSGFAFNYIRDDYPPADNPPHGWPDRTEVLWDILTWFQNTYNEPISVDPLAFTNRLGDAYPNPFNPTTTITYEIKEQAQVTLKVYNVAGQLVRTLVDDVQTPTEGGFAKEWNGLNNQGQPVSSGVYFYKLVTKDFSQTKKMVLLK